MQLQEGDWIITANSLRYGRVTAIFTTNENVPMVEVDLGLETKELTYEVVKFVERPTKES